MYTDLKSTAALVQLCRDPPIVILVTKMKKKQLAKGLLDEDALRSSVTVGTSTLDSWFRELLTEHLQEYCGHC